MKKLLFIPVLFFAVSAWASTYTEQFRYADNFAQKVNEIPAKNQTRFDYSGTTSGVPIYTGHAAKGVATSTEAWRVCKTTDSSSGPTLIQCVDDIKWDDRATASFS